jgi:hypothetical protein
MLREGDRVHHFTNSTKVGVIKRLYRTKTQLMTTMGTSEDRLMAEVIFPNEDKVYTYFAGDLFKTYD